MTRVRASVSLLLLVAVSAMAAGHLLGVVNGRVAVLGIPDSLPMVAFASVGAVVVWQHPHHRVGWLFLAAGVLWPLSTAGSEYARYASMVRPDLPGATWAAWYGEWFWIPWLAITFVFVMALFPDGRPLPGRWRWPLWAVGIVAAIATVGSMFDPVLELSDDHYGGISFINPMGLSWITDIDDGGPLTLFLPVLLIGTLTTAASVVVRYRRSRGEERQQLKWVLVGGFIVVVAFPTHVLLDFIAEGRFSIVESVLVLLPLAAGAAILKYRLYDIDVVISKTVVFAGLAAFITAIYVGIVVGIGSLLHAGDEPNLALSIVATAVVAVTFQPVRERLTLLANRLVFGRRATPYEVLSSFAGDLTQAAAPERTLERMTKLVADGTGADRVFVWLRVGETMRPTAVWPEVLLLEPIPERDLGDPAVFADFDHIEEVTHDGELLGAITLGQARGEALNHTEHELLNNLAGQVALLLRNLRLTEELRARIADLSTSRRRLLQAQDDERRRLERDLHDGSQQRLAHLTRSAREANESAEREGATQAATLLAQIADDGDEAIRTIQELAHGIYPPLLAAEGLPAALGARTAKSAVPVRIEAERLGRYDREIEAAVYFCVLEAVNNAAKYADASQVTVRLSQSNGHFEFEVIDDGIGFDPRTTPRGHGLTNITDRLDALGGHLHITGQPGAGTSVRGTVLAVPRHKEAHA